MTVMAFAGLFIIGLQSGVNAAAASIYPTSSRSNGVGWAGGVGRRGSILCPIIGGFLIAQGLTLRQLYLAAALPPVIGTIACYVLSRLYAERFGTIGFGKREPRERAAAEGGWPRRRRGGFARQLSAPHARYDPTDAGLCRRLSPARPPAQAALARSSAGTSVTASARRDRGIVRFLIDECLTVDLVAAAGQAGHEEVIASVVS